jgi:hypothetical protein
MSNVQPNERLSPSARARLDDYISMFANDIVSEAMRLNPEDVVTSRDVGDAFHQLHDKRARPEGWSPSREVTRVTIQPYALVVPLLSGLASLVTALLLFYVYSTTNQGILESAHIIILIAAFLAYIATLISFSTIFLAYYRLRRQRARAIRYAELGGRDDNDVAYYLAEALSSRSTKSDDIKYLTALFIPKWGRLEDRLRRLAIAALEMPEDIAEDYPIGPLLSRLTQVGVLDAERESEFARILDVRNRLAHGGRASVAETQVGLDYMDVLEDLLDARIRSHSAADGWHPFGVGA